MKDIVYTLSAEEYEKDLEWRSTLKLYALVQGTESSNNVTVWLDNLSDEDAAIILLRHGNSIVRK